jgi:hypothetical protein
MAGHGQRLDERLLGTGERDRQSIELIGAEQDLFGEPSGSCCAQQMELPAVVGPTGVAEMTLAAAGERSRRDRRSRRPPIVDTGTDILDDAGNLVAHDGPGLAERLGDMEIAPADSARSYPGHHLTGAGDRVVDFRRLQAPVDASEDDGAHVQPPMTTTGGSLIPCSDAHSFR